MTDNYKAILKLANEHGYRGFTALQEEAFRCGRVYDSDSDLFVIGETSSGKTLIPMLLYYKEVLDAKREKRRTPRMLFAVPYRALAAQKTLEIQQFFKNELHIVQSTGEYRQNDDAIQSGDVDIAVIITEKVYKYASRNPDFLAQYDYLVLDEAGLIGDSERGIRIDFILAWAHTCKMLSRKLRVIALGTPFFNWDAYIKAYNFVKIEAGGRPVKLYEYPVVFNKNWGVLRADGGNPAITRRRLITQKSLDKMRSQYETPKLSCEYTLSEDHLCPYKELGGEEKALICPDVKGPCKSPVFLLPSSCKNVQLYVLYQICSYHLSQGHQILIFLNNREMVKQLCKNLYLLLREELPRTADVETFKRELLQECELGEDDVYGILEDSTLQEEEKLIYYEALAGGIGFHSSAVPNELRTYIEKNLLESRNLRIVCSTETLAFGVNSNVDVVIVADMMKQDSKEMRYLSLNEYQNYIGRAGRYSKEKSDRETAGYVYTLLRREQQSFWERFREEAKHPDCMHSLFFRKDNSAMPFFILNLFSGESDRLSLEQLNEKIRVIPRPDGWDDLRISREVQKALSFLTDRELIRKETPRLLGKRQKSSVSQELYSLTALGDLIRGYILGSSDYDLIYRALDEQTQKGVYQDMDIPTLLYRFLVSKHAAAGLRGLFANTDAEVDIREIYRDLRKKYGKYDVPEWLEKFHFEDESQVKILHVLAALLAWMDSENPKTIFRRYKIHYSLLIKLAEQISYLLEIAETMLSWMLTERWNEKEKLFEQFHIDIVTLEEEIEKKKRFMHNMFCSLYYGIGMNFWQKLLEYLNSSEEEEARLLAESLSPSCINPDKARKLRRLAVRYRFFTLPSREKDADIEVRNNYRNQRWQYQEDIRALGHYFTAFFTAEFGRKFTG